MDGLTEEQIRKRIAWINEHENMFMLSPFLTLERTLLKEELARLEQKEGNDDG